MSDVMHKPGEWVALLRRIRFTGTRDGVRGATIKAAGFVLASYADFKRGDDIKPGTARLAVDMEVSYATAKKCLAALRRVGLIVLVRKAEKITDADVYRLDIPEDLLERDDIIVWWPHRYLAEIDKMREANRGTYKKATTADTLVDTDSDLRATQAPAETGPAEVNPTEPAGHAATRRTESAGGAASRRNQSAGASVTRHLLGTHRPLSDQPNHGDLRSDLEGPCVRSLEPETESAVVELAGRQRCPHNRSTRRRKDGTLRCPECAQDEQQPGEPVTIPELSPARCPAHGLKGGNRTDGQPHCPICRHVRSGEAP